MMTATRQTPNFHIVIVPTPGETIDVSTQGVDGGFYLTVYQRDSGYETLAFEVAGRPEDSNLLVEIRDKRGTVVAASRTVR